MSKKFLLLPIVALFVGAGCENQVPSSVQEPSAVVAPEAESSGTAGAVLATSIDKNFVLRGVGACAGKYGIYPNASAKNDEGLVIGTRYDLYHPLDPENSNLGEAVIQTRAQHAASPLAQEGVYTLAFQNDEIVAYAVIAERTDCEITLAER